MSLLGSKPGNGRRNWSIRTPESTRSGDRIGCLRTLGSGARQAALACPNPYEGPQMVTMTGTRPTHLILTAIAQR